MEYNIPLKLLIAQNERKDPRVMLHLGYLVSLDIYKRISPQLNELMYM